jgi:hypothetical protein
MPILNLPEHLHAGQYLKLRDFIPLERLTEKKVIFQRISGNENAWFFLEKFLEENPDKKDWIHWELLSKNESMVPLLEKYPEEICWIELSKNKNAMRLIEQDIIDSKNEWDNSNSWELLARNPGIFELDYQAIERRTAIFKEELMEKVYHPTRMKKIFDLLNENEQELSCIEKYI